MSMGQPLHSMPFSNPNVSSFVFSGRSYGYGKKKIKKDIVPFPTKKLPLCSVACTLQWISPECREETFGFENGMECRGCPIDICRGQLPIGGGTIGLDRWQNNRNWQNGGNWGQNGGFIDNFQNQNLDFLNQGQGGLFNGRFGTVVYRQRCKVGVFWLEMEQCLSLFSFYRNHSYVLKKQS
jgi:hypothetical protein